MMDENDCYLSDNLVKYPKRGTWKDQIDKNIIIQPSTNVETAASLDSAPVNLPIFDSTTPVYHSKGFFTLE